MFCAKRVVIFLIPVILLNYLFSITSQPNSCAKCVTEELEDFHLLKKPQTHHHKFPIEEFEEERRFLAFQLLGIS